MQHPCRPHVSEVYFTQESRKLEAKGIPIANSILFKKFSAVQHRRAGKKNFPLSSIGAPEKEKASQLCADWLCPLRGCFMPQAN